jgi:branched-chain amino acid transport system substrate-binding protein
MRRNLFGTAAFCLAAWALPAAAQLSDNTLKLGVATDLSSLYADINGPGAVLAVQMAIEDFGGSVLGQKIELCPATSRTRPMSRRPRSAAGTTTRRSTW